MNLMPGKNKCESEANLNIFSLDLSNMVPV